MIFWRRAQIQKRDTRQTAAAEGFTYALTEIALTRPEGSRADLLGRGRFKRVVSPGKRRAGAFGRLSAALGRRT